MTPKPVWRVASWMISTLLMLAFLVASLTTLAGTRMHRQHFAHWGYPDWFRLLTGAIELVGAVLVMVPRARFRGAVILACVMVGAIATHLRMGEYRMLWLPSGLLLLSVIDAWLSRRA